MSDTKINTIVNNCPDSPSSAIISYLQQQVDRAKFDSLSISKLVFVWIAKNISYDVDSWLRGDTSNIDIEYIFKKKTTFCAGYALLFEHICCKCGIGNTDIMVINGRAKGILREGESIDNLKSDHCWNAVKINGQWKLIDPCWGAGSISIKRTKTKTEYIFVKKLNDFWFCTPSHFFLLTHFPDNSHHMFIPFSVNLEQWVDFPILSENFFKYGMSLTDSSKYKPYHKFNKVNEPAIVIQFTIGKADIILQAYLLDNESHYYNSNLYVRGHFSGTRRSVDICICFKDMKIGEYFLNIFAGNMHNCNEFVCTYKFKINKAL